ncbi:hypothetical protein ACP70R_013170 [Stipagrostis hirtigluma subsp. patula]
MQRRRHASSAPLPPSDPILPPRRPLPIIYRSVASSGGICDPSPASTPWRSWRPNPVRGGRPAREPSFLPVAIRCSTCFLLVATTSPGVGGRLVSGKCLRAVQWWSSNDFWRQAPARGVVPPTSSGVRRACRSVNGRHAGGDANLSLWPARTCASLA